MKPENKALVVAAIVLCLLVGFPMCVGMHEANRLNNLPTRIPQHRSLREIADRQRADLSSAERQLCEQLDDLADRIRANVDNDDPQFWLEIKTESDRIRRGFELENSK